MGTESKWRAIHSWPVSMKELITERQLSGLDSNQIFSFSGLSNSLLQSGDVGLKCLMVFKAFLALQSRVEPKV